MPTKPTEKLLCVDALRHAEYYGMQEIFDNLYAKSANGEMFTDLMSLILSRENISLFSAQWGKCAVTGKDFRTTRDIHCHHKTPKNMGGTDKYQNLMLVLHPVHILIHATDEQTICQYLELLKLDDKQLTKVNDLRKMAGNAEILVNKKTKAYIGLLENLAI